MKLIDLLVQELPKRGGWPEGFDRIIVIQNQLYAAGVGFSEKPLGIFTALEGCVTKVQYESALAKHQPEWDGVGLPPVGVEFEHSFHANGFTTWHLRRCTAVGKHGVLCVDENDIELYLNSINNKFRPIRSEADKKREEAVQAMCNITGNGVKCNESTGWGKAWYELYDAIAAGKIPGVRIE